MEQLKNIKENLICQVQSQMANLANVDAKELGEVVDMIKDIEEAIYYCTITKAMDESKEQEKYQQQQEKMYYPVRYYGERGGEGAYRMNYTPMTSYTGPAMNYSSPMEYYNENYGDRMPSRERTPYNMQTRMDRDYREGRSPMMRKMYMETKEIHGSKEAKMKDLEKYMQELSHDVTEMIEDASVEEKQLLQQKLNTLISKIK